MKLRLLIIYLCICIISLGQYFAWAEEDGFVKNQRLFNALTSNDLLMKKVERREKEIDEYKGLNQRLHAQYESLLQEKEMHNAELKDLRLKADNIQQVHEKSVRENKLLTSNMKSIEERLKKAQDQVKQHEETSLFIIQKREELTQKLSKSVKEQVVLKKNIRDLEKKIKTINEIIDRKNEEHQALADRFQKQEKNKNQLVKKHDALIVEDGKLRKELEGLKQTISEKNKEHQVLTDRFQKQEKNKNQLVKKHDALIVEDGKLRKELEGLKQTIREKNKEHQVLTDRFQKQEKNKNQLVKKHDALTVEEKNLHKKILTLKNSNNEKNEEYQVLNNRYVKQEEDKSHLGKKYDQLTVEEGRLRSELTDLKARLPEILEESNQPFKEMIKELKVKMIDAESNHEKKIKKLQAVLAEEISSLKNVIAYERDKFKAEVKVRKSEMDIAQSHYGELESKYNLQRSKYKQENERLSNQLSEKEAAVSAYDKVLEEKENTIQEMYAKRNQSTLLLKENQNTITELNEKISRMNAQILKNNEGWEERWENFNLESNAKIRDAESQKQNIENKFRALKEKRKAQVSENKNQLNQVSHFKNENEWLQNTLNGLENELANLKAKHHKEVKSTEDARVLHEKVIKKYKKELKDQKQLNARLKAEFDNHRQEFQQMSGQLLDEKNQAEIFRQNYKKEQEGLLGDLNAKIKKLREKLKDVQLSNQQVEWQIEGLKEDKKEMNQLLGRCEFSADEMREKINILSTELKLTQEAIKENYSLAEDTFTDKREDVLNDLEKTLAIVEERKSLIRELENRNLILSDQIEARTKVDVNDFIKDNEQAFQQLSDSQKRVSALEKEITALKDILKVTEETLAKDFEQERAVLNSQVSSFENQMRHIIERSATQCTEAFIRSLQ